MAAAEVVTAIRSLFLFQFIATETVATGAVGGDEHLASYGYPAHAEEWRQLSLMSLPIMYWITF